MKNNIKSLYNFVDDAEKDRKYPVNSAAGIRAALKMFEGEMNEDEKDSIDLFKERFDQISGSVFNKNRDKISASSFQVYIRRVRRLLKDYESYGLDPKLMASWNPLKKHIPAKKSKSETLKKDVTSGTSEQSDEQKDGRDKYEMNTNSGKITLFVPATISEQEVELINSFVDFLKAKANLNKGKNVQEQN